MTPRENLQFIKLRLMSGEIDYKKAKELAIPFIKEMNNKAIELAKKYNQKYKPITFSGFMR